MLEFKEKELTGKIIGCAFTVFNQLGHGFLEKVYENALAIELRKSGLRAEQGFPITVRYGGQVVGYFEADLFVEGKVIVEIKAVAHLASAHEAQLVNYLKATGIEVGLLINFGLSVEVRRKIFQLISSGLSLCPIREIRAIRVICV